MKVTSISVAFRGTISLPGYNSIGAEFGQTVELEAGEDPDMLMPILFAEMKAKVAEALRESRPTNGKSKAQAADPGPYGDGDAEPLT